MALYQYFSAFVAISFFAVVILLIRRDSIQMGSAFRWVVIAIAALVAGIEPTLVDSLAVRLGISYGPILPLLLVCVFLLIKALLADIDRAKTQLKLDRLNQKLALLERDLDSLRECESANDSPRD